VYNKTDKGGNRSMDIIEAINVRISIRAFKPDPMPRETLRQIMELALRAPSGSNTQPWEFAIVSGWELEEIRRRFLEKAGEAPNPDMGPPREFPEPYESRRRELGAKMYAIKGIRREDTEGRGWWRLQGLKHFGAPCVIYLYLERSLCFNPGGVSMSPIFNCGLVAENIMLLAPRYGLGTVAQGQAVLYPDVVREVLGIPNSKFLVLGIAIGYPNQDDPINKLRSEREPLDKVAKWYGFDR
jgi:nitroreductase